MFMCYYIIVFCCTYDHVIITQLIFCIICFFHLKKKKVAVRSIDLSLELHCYQLHSILLCAIIYLTSLVSTSIHSGYQVVMSFCYFEQYRTKYLLYTIQLYLYNKFIEDKLQLTFKMDLFGIIFTKS